jgi:hypothetical protein
LPDPVFPAVLAFQFLEPLGLVDIHLAELLLPAVEGHLRDVVLAAHVGDLLAPSACRRMRIFSSVV